MPSTPACLAPPPFGVRRGWGRLRSRVVAVTLLLVAVAPLLHVLQRTADARRNIVYWDEFDTALAPIIALEAGSSPGAFLAALFQVNNEHRMVTSRLLFAGSYWLTGTIDFSVLQWLGNATIVAACLLLVWSAGARPRQLKLGLLLALLVFQLEHYENFLWSGASIDHFQVILLAVAAVVALQSGQAAGFWVGLGAALLATFTLAHGLAVWPAGAALLWAAGRRREFAGWAACAALAAFLFLLGFEFNRAQHFAEFSLAGAGKIGRYWLALLGAVPGLGSNRIAPWCGGLLLAALAYGLARGAWRREPIAWALVLFVALAAGLIAVGRAEHSGGHVYSRYYILSAVAWALTLFLLIERHSHPRRPLAGLVFLLPGLLGFNVLANREFTDETDSWIICRDLAAVNFIQHGTDGHGPFHLHPHAAHATALLRRSKSEQVYELGSVCPPVPFPPGARESNRISYFVEDIAATDTAVAIRGWAGIPDQSTPRGGNRLILRSERATHVFRTATAPRTDVPRVMQQPAWTNAGFHFAARVAELPPGDFQIGLLIQTGGRAEFIMTGHRLQIPSEPKPVFAAAQQ